jgi:hypothetical protein
MRFLHRRAWEGLGLAEVSTVAFSRRDGELRWKPLFGFRNRRPSHQSPHGSLPAWLDEKTYTRKIQPAAKDGRKPGPHVGARRFGHPRRCHPRGPMKAASVRPWEALAGFGGAFGGRTNRTKDAERSSEREGFESA